MGIEKIGLNVVNTIEPKPRNYVQKSIRIEEARREDTYLSIQWSKTAEQQRLIAESERISDINKINSNGQRSPAPNVPYTKGIYRDEITYFKRDTGNLYDIVA